MLSFMELLCSGDNEVNPGRGICVQYYVRGRLWQGTNALSMKGGCMLGVPVFQMKNR